jgi:hypothetical protein
MIEVKPEQLVSKTDKLLYSILLELQKLNASMCPVARDTEEKEYRCKYCGELFVNRHKMAAHAGKCPKNPKNATKEA